MQTSLISHCEQNGNRMAMLDAPPGMTPQQIRSGAAMSPCTTRPFAALYYPWIKVENPIGVNGDAEVFIPPSGHIAGVWARTDETRGVWKAPANDTIRGCLDVAYGVTQNEQAVLNPIGINCIRPFGTRGIRIWGARTLSSDSDWRYINVRRLFNMVETTIAEGTQWAVFEPNDVVPVGGHQAHAQRVPAGAVECRRAVRPVRRPGVLRQVRRRDQPARVDRPRAADRRGGHRPGQAGRVRRLPHRPAQAGRELTSLLCTCHDTTAKEPAMPNEALINNDPMVSQNFFLEIDGSVVSILSSVSGLDIEMEVVTMEQAGANGKVQVVKTLGKANKAPDLSLVRMAPPDMTQDKLWGWFNDIRDKGILLSDRTNNRKSGSIVMYDSTNAEIARFNFTNGWPSKISTDQLSVESNDPVKETITLTVESLARVK